MATIHGAAVLGLGRGAGTLRPGAPADAIALAQPAGAGVRDMAERLTDPEARVVSVLVAGEPVHPCGRGLSADA